MSAALKWNLISAEDYLRTEATSPIKREYVGGVLYAMAGGRNAHSLIKGNIFGATFVRLRGHRCRPFDSDTKIRIQLPTHFRFYYPDDSVICEQNALTDSFQDKPVVIFEALSRGTRRLDEGEKKDAYLTIPSLKVYVLVEQDMPALIVYRRASSGFEREIYEGLDAVLPLEEIEMELPLAEIYEGINFSPEPAAEE